MDRTNPQFRLIITLCIVAAVCAIATFIVWRAQWPRSEGLLVSLEAEAKSPESSRAMVASAVGSAFRETRENASRWSGIYWGFSFVAVVSSALAGLVLKLESLPWSDKVKKDIAACLSVFSALLVTLTTSGDFHRKWQANRIAAAEIEELSYRFLRDPASDPRKHLLELGQIQLHRQLEIVGSTNSEKSETTEKDHAKGD